MNNKRSYTGICVDYITYLKCYDAAKNKWTSLSDTKNEHDEWPIIWNDNCDTNLIIIGSIYGCKLSETNWMIIFDAEEPAEFFGGCFVIEFEFKPFK